MRHAAGRQRKDIHVNQIPGMVDVGQRYRVAYRDGCGTRCTYGFTNDRDEAARWVAKIAANPMWKKPRIVDRHQKAL